jgi:ADP-dependent NAD(P)H-hydrate dehydratase
MKRGKPLDEAALGEHPLPPVDGGDKDSHGRILIVAGSREVPGAALLAATAAMRAGAGKLQIATVESVAPQLGLMMPEAMVIGLAEDGDGGFGHAAAARIAEAAAEADAVIAGPGVRAGGHCGRIAEALIAAPVRLALDAALLHSVSPLAAKERAHGGLPILLPHAGELASLLECDEQKVAADPIGSGLRAAELYRAVVLVKGVTSHVVCPQGRIFTYDGGSPGLGVSGSGDALAGIVGGLLARGAGPLTALLWSVWLHGEAGARLAKRVGPVGFLAREIPDEVPALLAR